MSLIADAVEDYFTTASLGADDLPAVLHAVRHHFGVEVHTDPPADPALAQGTFTYLDPEDRFVAALVASYDPDRDDVETAQDAARWALDLTRDGGADGTHWWVFDRSTGTGQVVEQDTFDPELGGGR